MQISATKPTVTEQVTLVSFSEPQIVLFFSFELFFTDVSLFCVPHTTLDIFKMSVSRLRFAIMIFMRI